MFRAIALVAMALVASTAAQAQSGEALIPKAALASDETVTTLAASPLVKGQPTSFDVMGIKLGMSMREVHSVAAERGIMRPSAEAEPMYAGTFEAQAMRIAARRAGRAAPAEGARMVSQDNGVTADGSSMGVNFVAAPEGPRVSRMVYETTVGDHAALRAELTARYGAPDLDTGMEITWCGGTPRCNGTAIERSDRLTVSVMGRTARYTLERSQQFQQQADAAIRARADRLAAGTTIASAF